MIALILDNKAMILEVFQCYLLAVHQPHQPLTAADVVTDAAVGQPVDHGAVVHDISAEEQLVVSVVEADAAPRVSRHVEHRQLSVAQVDHITWSREREDAYFILLSLGVDSLWEIWMLQLPGSNWGEVSC